ncbi:RAVE subunit 2/Rogdi [Amylocarpus encephaloides]|uniref:RAVE subunit 2/Rogdi n=1 Tax=Amylocarpus encephaloides TaxID=45428 RepID=A0A9P8C6G9_9HELO|nr:RAVE subunit 2/Rogdi [Amylocarpus encephaloides]
MATAVFPYLPADELKKAEDESNARELSWFLDNLQEKLAEFKHGLEDCYARLSPLEDPESSTLVISTPKSELVKGHVTRVGTRVVKGSLHLRLKTLPSLHLKLSETSPLILPQLSHLRTLLNNALDCVDITRWTGDRHSAAFITSQLHLLHSLLLEAQNVLTGPSFPVPRPGTPHPLPIASRTSGEDGNEHNPPWYQCIPDPNTFAPPVPENLSLHLIPTTSSLILTIRVLEPTAVPPSAFNKFALAIGAQRRLEHDEMDGVFMWKGEEVKVKEKVRVESGGDPVLLVLGVKLQSLEKGIEGAMMSLRAVMGLSQEKDDD